MRAARYYGQEDIRVEEIPEPKVGAGQVKVIETQLVAGATTTTALTDTY